MRRLVLRGSIAMIFALPVVGSGAIASATPVDLVCPLAATINFSPGLTLLSKPVQISGTASAGTAVSSATPCSSVLTGVPYTGATGSVAGTGTLGCTLLGPGGLAGNASGTLPITWNNGDTSTITWSATLVAVIPTVTASVTSGALAGSTLVVAPLPTGLTGNCLTSPITSLSFAGLVAFAQV